MDGQAIAGTILAILKKHNVNDDDARTVLGLVAQKLVEMAKAEKVAKAQRLGLTVEELDGRETGKAIAARVNAKLGYNRKGAK